MPDFDSHSTIIDLLNKAQEADSDNRQNARTADVALNKKDGQWEPGILAKWGRGRPRYTYDLLNDMVDDIAGEIEQNEFGIKVRPMGGQATEDIAEIYDGMARNIQSYSHATDTYDAAGRKMVGTGFDAWRVKQRYSDTGQTFDQDLYIDAISNALDSVWYEPTAFERTRRTARYCFVLEAFATEEYDDRWPDGSGQSVSQGVTNNFYSYKPEVIVVGEILYKVTVTREIVEMSDGSIYEVDDDFKKVSDELKENGITEVRRRDAEYDEVKSRLFDGNDWLNKEQDTAFTLLPVIPVYANFTVSENKAVWWGLVEKKLDPARINNYTISREVEEGILQPAPSIFMTREQYAADSASLSTMNVDPKPVQTYTHQADQPPPYRMGGQTPNPTLSIIGENARNMLREGIDNPNQPAGLRSGVALERVENTQDTKNFKYIKAMEVAICYTGEILITSMPTVYDTKRIVRILGEDGKGNMVTLNDQILDTDTLEMVEINDLSQGLYDVVCDSGPAFKNRQQETVAAFNEVATIDPTIIERGKDIWLGNINAPGMDMMADRARADLLQQGLIPEDQLTDEEQQEIAQRQAEAANNPPPPDPLMIAAQAEQQNAQTAAAKQQFEQQKATMELQLKQQDQQIEVMKLQGQQEQAQFQGVLDANKQSNDNLSSQISGLKDLIEAFGIQVLGGTKPAELIAGQGANIQQTQKEELQ